MHVTHIRTKLIAAFLVISLIPLVFSALMNVHMAYNTLIDNSKQALMGAASQTANEIDSFILDNLSTIRTQSLLPDLSEFLELAPAERQGSVQETRVIRILDSFRRKDQINISSYAVFDRAGLLLLDTYGGRVFDSFELIHLRETMNSGLPYVYPLLYSQESGVTSLSFSSPIRNSRGELIGVLRVRYNINALQRMIYVKEGLLGPGSLAILLDRDMVRMADSHDQSMVMKPLTVLNSAQINQIISAGKNIVPIDEKESLPDLLAMINNIHSQPHFTARLYPSSDQLMLCAALRLKTRPWIVICAQPEDVFLNSLRNQVLYTILLSIGIAVIATTAAFFTAQTLSSPLTRLTSMAGKISRGDLTQRVIKTTDDEIGQLSETFNEMAHALQTSQQKLVAYTTRLEVLHDTIPDAVFIHSPDGRIIDVNRRCIDLFGYTQEELMAMNVSDLSGKDYSQQITEEMLSPAEQSGHFTLEWVGRKKDGTEFPMLVRLCRLQLDGGEHIIAVITDITERKLAEDALRSSELHMRAIVDASPVPQFVIGKDHRITHWNRALEEYSGILAEEVIGTNQQWRAFYSHERPCMADLIVDGTIVQIPLWYKGKYNRSRIIGDAFEATDFFPFMKGGTWLYFTAAPIRDARGNIIGAVETLADVTDQKQAEQTSTDAKNYLEKIINSIADPIFVKDRQHRWILLNDALCSFMGHTRRELLGKSDYDFFPRSEADVFWAKDEIVFHTGEENVNEEDFTDANGTVHIISTKKTLYRDEKGVEYLVGIIRDVTEIKRAAEVLRLSAERSDILLRINQMSDAPLEKIMEYAFEEAVRLTRSEIGYLGLMNDDETVMNVQVWSHGVMPECRTGVTVLHFPIESGGLWAEAVRQRKPIITNDYDAPNPWKKGCPEGHIALRRHMNIPVIAGFKVVLVAGVGNKTDEYDDTDVKQLALLMEGTWRIIERRRAEEDRRKLEDQLVQAQKMESVGRLAGGVAHDFNNMLTPIMGYAELLRMELPQDDPRQSGVKEILRAAERSRDLVRQLLAFARKQTLEMKPVDLNRIIAGFEQMLRRTLPENVTLEKHLAPSLGTIQADVGQIEQIILNLAVNAQDAMPEGGGLLIKTSMAELDDVYALGHDGVIPGSYIVMEISDTGIGIDRETRERMFDPFFTTKTGKGTGLGLATVYGIVKQHGGHISVYSEPGQGTTFRVYFPQHGEPAVAVEPVRTPEIPVHGRETLLVVEDQEQVRTMAVQLLSRHGYRVLDAGDLKTAREAAALHEGEINLLITDVVLPDGNGKELYESLFDIGKLSKVLFMSGYPSEVISHHGVLEPGVHYIQKPFSLTGFLNKVRDVLES